MFHVEVNLIYICYLVIFFFLMRPSGDQPDVPCGPRGERFAHPWLRVLASHTGSSGCVAQGAWKLEDLPMGRCHFLSDPWVFGYIF